MGVAASRNTATPPPHTHTRTHVYKHAPVLVERAGSTMHGCGGLTKHSNLHINVAELDFGPLGLEGHAPIVACHESCHTYK